jgi:hypothetical protein
MAASMLSARPSCKKRVRTVALQSGAVRISVPLAPFCIEDRAQTASLTARSARRRARPS